MQTRDGEVKVVPQLLCCTQCVFERCHFYSQVNGLYAHFVLHSSKFQYNSEIAFVVFATYLENTYFFPSHRWLSRDYRLVCRPV